MKRSTKVSSIIIVFFLIIAGVIIGRAMIGMHFEKKFSKKPPPELIVTTVKNYNFSQKLESFGTALPSRTKSFRLKKSELLTPIKFNQEVKKGDIIANLKTGNIVAPFDGVLGKRGLSDDVLVSESSIILTLDDSSIIFSDLKIPETYAAVIKKSLPVEATFSGYKNKIYIGEVDSVASRINAETRTLLVRIKIINDNSKLIPGALLEVAIKYNEKNSLQKTEKFGADILKYCVKVGGVLTGEHGVGVEKRELMCEMFNNNDIQQQIKIKKALDASSLLNPGKVYPILRKCAEEGRVHVHRGKTKFPDIPRF